MVAPIVFQSTLMRCENPILDLVDSFQRFLQSDTMQLAVKFDGWDFVTDRD